MTDSHARTVAVRIVDAAEVEFGGRTFRGGQLVRVDAQAAAWLEERGFATREPVSGGVDDA